MLTGTTLTGFLSLCTAMQPCIFDYFSSTSASSNTQLSNSLQNLFRTQRKAAANLIRRQHPQQPMYMSALCTWWLTWLHGTLAILLGKKWKVYTGTRFNHDVRHG